MILKPVDKKQCTSTRFSGTCNCCLWMEYGTTGSEKKPCFFFLLPKNGHEKFQVVLLVCFQDELLIMTANQMNQSILKNSKS